MWAWVLKLVSGFMFWRPDKFGKLIYILTIIGVVLFIFWKVTSPTQRTTQRAETIINNNYDYSDKDKFFLGTKIFGFKIGVSK